jgi:hypothetical protein
MAETCSGEPIKMDTKTNGGDSCPGSETDAAHCNATMNKTPENPHEETHELQNDDDGVLELRQDDTDNLEDDYENKMTSHFGKTMAETPDQAIETNALP